MSRRHALVLHRQKLDEAREIMNSMKSLAFMETRKLAGLIDTQRELVRTLLSAADDLLRFYPECLPMNRQAQTTYLLLGSERGFCGGFNEELLARLEQEPDADQAQLIACGHKLGSRLEQDPRLLASLDGAAVLDETGLLLNRLTDQLADLNQNQGAMRIILLYHDHEQEDVVVQRLLPPFEPGHPLAPANTVQAQIPPELNLPPQQLFAELIDHYLFAALHEVIYISLMAENYRRTQHLDGAVHYLEERLETMRRRDNQLRQEEITEEIEVLLLNASSGDLAPESN